MTNRELLKSIYALREKAESNKLIIFVGAGVSCNVEGMPSWHGLIMEMAKTIGYTKCSSCRCKNDCVKRCSDCSRKDNCSQKCLTVDVFSIDDYLKIPQFVFNQSPKNYREIIEKCIADKTVPSAPLSKAIFEINPAHIITTNYDRLLETSESVFSAQYDVVISDSDLLNTSKSKYIIKMHGDVLQPETIILKEQDYLQYSQTHVLIELFIKSLFADHTVLFLGYSLNDYNVKLIVSWINYLRSQSNSLLKEIKIGYLVIDEEAVDKNRITYLKKNNIEVLNIRSLPLIKSIPDELGNEHGKRLYSFLKILSNPALEVGISSQMSIETAVSFLKLHHISDYTLLLKFLRIDEYSMFDSVLTLYSEKQYIRLTKYLNSETENVATLKQLLINCDVGIIQLSNCGKKAEYPINVDEKDVQVPDLYYSLYLENRYRELLDLCKSEKSVTLEREYYLHFLTGYADIEADFGEIDYNELSLDDKIAYLHNSAAIDAQKNIRFNPSRVTHFINNITDSKTRQIFQPYLDMYDDNADRRLRMILSLDTLKANIKASSSIFFSGSSISKIYEIKSIAFAQYRFYFFNHLFILGFSNPAKFFRPYIEAILYASSDEAERSGNFLDFATVNKKYCITTLDLDILSKFITSKDLASQIKSINVTQFSADEMIIARLVSCFTNLADSLILSQTYGFRYSSITVLINLTLLLTKVPLSESNKSNIAKSIQRLFSDKVFNSHFWSLHCPDYKVCIAIVEELLKLLAPCPNANCIISICNTPEFFSYVINSNFYSSKRVINYFSPDGNCEEIERIIDSETYFDKKVILMRIFHEILSHSEKVHEYQSLLSKNFFHLDPQAIYDFIFCKWLEPTQQDISGLLSEVLSLYQNRNPEIRTFPDKLEQKLECIYILHINDIIKKLDELDELCEDYSHLHFLLHPEAFDYKKVDFSNYMWENFARIEKYMAEFIKHRDEIIPLIKDHIRSRIATDTEKKILYGFLLHGDEIWDKD